ncbi:MAG: Ig-like domain-containing protein [Gemmatimonas sp.]
MLRIQSLRTLALGAALLSALACGGGDSGTAPTPPVQSVSVSPSATTLTAAGEVTTLSAQVRLSNGSVGTQSVTWSSTNPAVATVNAGTVTAVSSGQTTINATAAGVTGSATITVAIPTVQTVTVTPATATLTAVGQTRAMAAEVRLSNGALGSQAPTWSSTNTSIATVSTTGVVTAVASGQTNIVATIGTVTGQAAITVALPVVQTVTVSPATTTLVSLGATTLLTAEVRMSDGALGTQTPTWTSSNPAVATISGRTVTAVANGTTTITATVGTVSGTATITVEQVVASVRILPTDTVIKSAAQLRGAALDARGNVIGNAPLQWTAVTPLITTVSSSGALTPLSTGVARMRVTSGNFTATSIVRTIWNVTQLSDLYPLWEYSASSGQRRALSDIGQNHADARGVMMGQVWSYLETILPSGGTATTDMLFTTWTEIWLAAAPFCGGVLIANSTIHQNCNTPHWIHLMVPGTSPNDQVYVTRFLSRQFLLSSMTTSNAFPWFLTGFSQWLGGGAFQGSTIVGGLLPAHIADFRNGDTLNLLAPMDTLVVLPNARFNAGIELRTPVAVRQAQSIIFVHYLNREYPTLIPAILARIRATPGAAFTNAMLLQEITTRTGKTIAQLDTGYLVYARTLRP